MRKYDIARLLARNHGLSSYLEIATPTTGKTYRRIDANQFTRRVRVMYRCEAQQLPEADSDIVSRDESSEAALDALLDSGERFALVFVDPWHSYASSRLDIEYALRLVEDDGVVLVHDCNPPRERFATPNFRQGSWCGRTFAAYLDVVQGTPGLAYFTVDCDYGCGVISRREHRADALFELALDGALAAQWQAVDDAGRYSFLRAHRAALLHLVSPTRLRVRAALRNFTGGFQTLAALRR